MNRLKSLEVCLKANIECTDELQSASASLHISLCNRTVFVARIVIT